jgi:prepilin-type N-terminal cleavage/methylation domain-containing protein
MVTNKYKQPLKASSGRMTKQKNKGFTLVETLVAIAILSISILSTFTAVQSALQSSLFARDQINAFYLIQEAMESVRNTRDGNALANIASLSSGGSGVNWLHGISESAGDPCYFGNVCIVDSPQKQMTYCGTSFGSCPFIKEDTVSGLFGYNNNWTDTKFKREIQLQQIGPDEIIVSVRVSWSGKTIQIQETLFNTR